MQNVLSYNFFYYFRTVMKVGFIITIILLMAITFETIHKGRFHRKNSKPTNWSKKIKNHSYHKIRHSRMTKKSNDLPPNNQGMISADDNKDNSEDKLIHQQEKQKIQYVEEYLENKQKAPLQEIDIAKYFNEKSKSLKFRSYYPHFLHSYSYPTPITPHFYFARVHQNFQSHLKTHKISIQTYEKPVFFVKDKQIFKNGKQLTQQIIYVNGKRESGLTNFFHSAQSEYQNQLQIYQQRQLIRKQMQEQQKLLKRLMQKCQQISQYMYWLRYGPPIVEQKKRVQKRPQRESLKFMMVVENKNMLHQPVQTTLAIRNNHKYISIVSVLGNQIVKCFIVYFIEDGNKVIQLDKVHDSIAVNVRNYDKNSNTQSWKTPKQLIWENMEAGPIFEQIYNTFILQFQYSDYESARKIKLCVHQIKYQPLQSIPSSQQLMIQQIFQTMEERVKIDNEQYKIEVEKQKKQLLCEEEAQRQLLQGLSFQYGDLQLRNGSQSLYNQPTELLSFCPSRKRFPWGFLWDDGFHCEVAVRKNPDIAISVIKSWLDTITQTGWIPREQNRGDERQDLCNCPRFMAKDIKDANPPTLVLSLYFLAKNKLLSEQIFEKKYYQKLKKWYDWFKATQQTQTDSYIFRWHDSITNEGSFNSGLDDFPRLKNTEGHIDCQSWMKFFADSMALISSVFGDDGSVYQCDSEKIKIKLLQNFIDPTDNVPKDFSKQKFYNTQFGYPSILPLAFGILDQGSLEFTATMNAIKNQLDCGHGLTSISMVSPQYLKSADSYWRGPVWININYLFLRGIKLYYPSQMQFYEKLRSQIIETVCSNLNENGHFYENYIDGKGSFSYPFTGWTALISIIIKQNY